MVWIVYAVQFVFGAFVGYVVGNEIEREAEFVGLMFIIATGISITAVILGAFHDMLLTFLVWMIVSWLASEITRKFIV